ncbi:MAG: TonB-dependent receptor [Bacteroidota bacterium]
MKYLFTYLRCGIPLWVSCFVLVTTQAQPTSWKKGEDMLSLADPVQSLERSSQEVVSLKQFLGQLEYKYNIHLSYAEELVANKFVRQPNDKGQDNVELILRETLKPLSITFVQVKDVYILQSAIPQLTPVPGEPLREANPEKFFQSERTVNRLMSDLRYRADRNIEQTISGKVLDLSTDEPIPGVNILVKGTTVGTLTDAEGNYRLTAPDDASTLVFSSVGYTSEEVEINGRTIINIALAPDIQSLSEVVVIGYGTQRRKDLTGSVASISEEEIKLQPIASFEQSLQGQVPGVQVTQTSNAPGGGISLRIRGGNSINAGNEPLYVIDGIPIYNDNDAFAPSRGNTPSQEPSSNALANLNPNDIASIEILKDASATAIYGSRGSNGVVLITTKRGKSGKPQTTYEGYYGIQEAATRVDVANANEYTQFYNDIISGRQRNGRGQNDLLLTEDIIANFADIDWQEELFRQSSIQNHQLTFSGGSSDILYSASINYFDQEGVVPATDFSRYSARLNLDVNATDWLKLGNSFSFTHSIRNASILNANGNGNQGLVYNALAMPPIVPVTDPEGNLYDKPEDWLNDLGVSLNPGLPNMNSPLVIARDVVNRTVTNRMIANFFAEITPTEHLTIKSSFGGDLSDANLDFFVPSNIRGGDRTNGLGVVAQTRNINWINTNTATYARIFDGIHDFNVLIGSEFQANRNERMRSEGRNFFTDNLGADNLGLGAEFDPPNTSETDWSLASFFGRINYQLMNKYLFTVTLRADGSSRFGAGNKWGTFPSAAVGWRISEENFLKNNSAISNMKLRASYGLTGNTEIGTYQSLSTLNTTRNIIGGTEVIGLAPQRIPNPDLRWEQTEQYDIGLDIGLWQERITFTADYYQKTTKDLLFNVAIPLSSGFGTSLQNIGSVENRGVEFTLSSMLVQKTDFSWSINGNLSINRNKVLDLGDNNDIVVGRRGGQVSGASGSSLLRVGEPVGVFFGNRFESIWQSEEEIDEVGLDPTADPGEPRYEDIDGDGTFNQSNDRAIIGDPNPDFIYGLTSSWTFKNFDLSVFLQGSQGNDILNFTRARFLYAFLGGRENRFPGVVNSWQPGRITNPTTEVPEVGGASRTGVDTRLVEDGSYLRIQNIRLGYRFDKMRFISAARVYFSVQNAFTFTDYSGFDPDVNFAGQSNLSQGIDLNGYPIVRTYTFGVNITL